VGTGRDSVRFLAASGPFTARLGLSAPDRDGGAIPAHEARVIVLRLRGDQAWPALIALHGLIAADGIRMPSRRRPDRLTEDIAEAIERGRLRLYRGWGRASAPAPAPAPDANVGSVAALVGELMGDAGHVLFQGRRYRLARASELSRDTAFDTYRPVPSPEARLLLGQMAARSTGRPDLRESWTQAAALISRGDGDDRLVLLRFVPTVGVAPANQAPAETPSQIRNALAPDDWIEIQLVYDDGTPFDGACQLQLPDGRTIDGTPDESGLVRVDGLSSSGDCKLTFPDIAAALGPA
jgi:hypothetical protein